MNVLIVLTSHDRLGETGKKTGFWLEELASPYYALKDAGARITLASPAGGRPPMDPESAKPDAQTDATKRFESDDEAQRALASAKRLSDVSADDFDAVFYPGGHGPLWDLAGNERSIRLIEGFAAQEKPVAAVCHAPAALLNAKAPDGSPLTAGKKVTGFSNSEESAVGLEDVVPFLLEDELKKRGGRYEKSDDWQPHVVTDGLLITGQNPASSAGVAEALLARLRG